VLLSVDQKSEGKSVIVTDCHSNLVHKGVSLEILAGVTALPSEEMVRRAISGSGGSEHFDGEGNVERTLERGSDAKCEEKEEKTEFVHLIKSAKKDFTK